MRKINLSVLTLAVTTLFLRFSVSADAAIVLYETSFESPEYQVGNLTGQNSWTADVGLSVNAARIENTAGGQELVISGPSIPQVAPNFYSGWYRKSISSSPIIAGTPKVSVSADFRLDLNLTQNPPFLYAFLLLSDSNGNPFNSISIDFAGGIVGQNFATPNNVVVSPTYGANSFHNLRIDLDFSTRQAQFFADSNSFGSLAFNPNSTAMIRDVTLVLQSSDPLTSTLRVDNLRIVASVPEPSSGILLVAAFTTFVCNARLRSSKSVKC